MARLNRRFFIAIAILIVHSLTAVDVGWDVKSDANYFSI